MLSAISWCLLAAAAFAGPSRVEIAATDSYPEFRVDGKPFFIHAASFSYFRIPRDLWESSLETYRDMGINTVDLYIPWNWHEAAPAELDLEGRTNARKDLLGLLEIIKRLGLRAIVRPGPYICAEWKNGGYPDWLLSDPSYKMARRSILEGRYPPLSSLQYPDPESAAKGWLANPLHMRQVERWYAALASRALVPYSIDRGGPIFLVQIDDDQPAGWQKNGPVFWEYMKRLRDLLRQDGVTVPMFLNPPDTQVPSLGDEALGPPHLWLMDQWYQRFYGVALSTANLIDITPTAQSVKLSPEFPPGTAEFNAGFFGMENNPYGMASDPSGTLTASRVLIQNGLKALEYFPIQDSLYPAGFEVPSANPHYVWESALDVGGRKGPKAAAIERNGTAVRIYGTLLAGSHEWADAGIIDPLHALDLPSLSTSAVSAVEKNLLAAERRFIEERVAGDWVDPQAQTADQLLRYSYLLRLPAHAAVPAISSKSLRALRDYEKAGGKLVEWDQFPKIASIKRKVSAPAGLYATELASNEGSLPLGRRDPLKENYGFLVLTNLGSTLIEGSVSAADPYDAEKGLALGRIGVPAKDSLILPLRVRLGRLLPERPAFLAETDEIRYATGELQSASASAGSVTLAFYAPSGAEIALKLERAPKRLLLNGRPFAAEPTKIAMPPGEDQRLELIYEEIPAPKLAASTKLANITFPGRIDYQLRPNIRLPSVPVLIAADNDGRVTVSAQNPSSTPITLQLTWASDRVSFQPALGAIRLKPRQTGTLRFRTRSIAGLLPATLTIEQDAQRAVREIRLLRVPRRKAVGYPFDFDRDGNQEWVLENDRLRVVVDPAAGGRVVQLVDKRRNRENIASTGGLMRDMFAAMEPLDLTWEDKKLPAWTRSRKPGLANRAYAIESISADHGASITLFYRTPDVAGGAADIRKKFTLGDRSEDLKVRWEVRLSSAAVGQEFRIRDIPLLSNAQDKRNQKDAASLRLDAAEGRWLADWSSPISVALSTSTAYAVIETGLGPMTEPKTYVYEARYQYRARP